MKRLNTLMDVVNKVVNGDKVIAVEPDRKRCLDATRELIFLWPSTVSYRINVAKDVVVSTFGDHGGEVRFCTIDSFDARAARAKNFLYDPDELVSKDVIP